MNELSPPGGSEGYEACDDEGAAFGRPKPSPLWGEGGPKGRMRGQIERGIIPVGTLISLASLDSFPLEGGSHYGAHLCVRPARPCDDL